MRARGRSSRALFTSEGRAGSQGARARLCPGGGRVTWGPRPSGGSVHRTAPCCLPPPPPASVHCIGFPGRDSSGLLVELELCQNWELCKDRSGVSPKPELGAVVPQQCPCEAWWQVCPAVLMPSATSPSRMAPRRPPRRPSHRPASARSGRGYYFVPMPQAAEWKEGVACRELGLRVFQVYWPQSDMLASQMGSEVERPVCVHCRKTAPCCRLRHALGRLVSCAVQVAQEACTKGTPVVTMFLTSALPLAGTMQMALGFS